MNRVIVLDSGLLGMITHPTRNLDVKDWLVQRIQADDIPLIPDIADYEVRRELLRAEKRSGITRLDQLGESLGVISTTPSILRDAAELWATTRRNGRPTADNAALDVDVILAAHAQQLSRYGYQVVVATTNVAHPALFTDARLWSNIA